MPHATLVAWYRDDSGLHFLTGTESTYHNYIDFPAITGDQSLEDAIRAELPEKTRFVIRTQRSTGQTRYTIQREGERRGFPKGGSKDEDRDIEQTARREFREEVGYTIPGVLDHHGIVNVDDRRTHLYSYMVPLEEREALLTAIATMEANRTGELFDVKFQTASTIERSLRRFNKLSAECFRVLRKKLRFRGSSRHRTQRAPLGNSQN